MTSEISIPHAPFYAVHSIAHHADSDDPERIRERGTCELCQHVIGCNECLAEVMKRQKGMPLTAEQQETFVDIFTQLRETPLEEWSQVIWDF